MGYAAYGQSVKTAVEPLVASFGIDLFDDGLQVRCPLSGTAQFVAGFRVGEQRGQSASREASTGTNLGARAAGRLAAWLLRSGA
jgi:hypothetical protein